MKIKHMNVVVACVAMLLVGMSGLANAEDEPKTVMEKVGSSAVVENGADVTGSHSVTWANGSTTQQTGTATVSAEQQNASGQNYVTITATGTVNNSAYSSTAYGGYGYDTTITITNTSDGSGGSDEPGTSVYISRSGTSGACTSADCETYLKTDTHTGDASIEKTSSTAPVVITTSGDTTAKTQTGQTVTLDAHTGSYTGESKSGKVVPGEAQTGSISGSTTGTQPVGTSNGYSFDRDAMGSTYLKYSGDGTLSSTSSGMIIWGPSSKTATGQATMTKTTGKNASGESDTTISRTGSATVVTNTPTGQTSGTVNTQGSMTITPN